jgi:tetrahydromethanopterin S-methyltransferase subunit G
MDYDYWLGEHIKTKGKNAGRKDMVFLTGEIVGVLLANVTVLI